MSKLGIARATTTVQLVTDLSLLGEHEAAEAELERLSKNVRPDRMNSAPELRDAAKRVQELEQKMDASVVLVKLRGLKRSQYADLQAEHPERKDNDLDKSFGVNSDTFFDAVIPLSIVEATWKSTGEPVELEWAEISDQLTEAQYAQFVTAVMKVNNGKPDVPFSRSASVVTRT